MGVGGNRNRQSRKDFLQTGALDTVEELPPQIERSFGGAAHARAIVVAHRRAAQDIVAHVPVIAIGPRRPSSSLLSLFCGLFLVRIKYTIGQVSQMLFSSQSS